MEDLRATHTYHQHGPFTRARVIVYGRTPVEAVETARRAVAHFAAALPEGTNCWAAEYEGFEDRNRRHAGAFTVAFGVTNGEHVRGQIDALVAAF